MRVLPGHQVDVIHSRVARPSPELGKEGGWLAMREWKVIIKDDGTAEFPGINWSNGTKPIVVWEETKTHVVLKFPPSKVWTGYGMPWKYKPAEFMVTEIIEAGAGDGTERRMRLREVLTMPVSKRGA